MFSRMRNLVIIAMTPCFLLLTIAAGCLSFLSQRVTGDEPSKSAPKAAKQKELLKERLAVVREIVRLSKQVYGAGAGSVDTVKEAIRMECDAELQLCDSDKERIAVLERFVAETKKLEELTANLSKTGQGAERAALLCKADRLQAEIALEQAKAKAAGQVSSPVHDRAALAEKLVAIKRAAVRVAEAQKMIALARLAPVKAQVAEARATESYLEIQVKRYEELVKQSAVGPELLDERRSRLDAARAQTKAAEGKVAESEAQVLLEQARVEAARLEVEAAELSLKQQK